MLEGKRILAVVPARGGSKGIPLKNIKTIGGIPLVGIVGNVVKDCSFIDRCVVSTDHDEIAQTAKKYGIDAPFMRPKDISGDRIADLPVLRHALAATESNDGQHYDIIMMLQPTSPMRNVAHLERTIRQLIENRLDATWTVSETDSKGHPLKQLTISTDGLLDYYDPAGAHIIARQQLSPVYHRNGVAYALTRECLLDPADSLLGKKTGAVIIEELMANIDTPFDLEFAEYIAARQ